MNPVLVGDVPIGAGAPLAFIAGPCVIEEESACMRIAEAVKRSASQAGVPVIFKASFDKANRTSIASFRGPGLVEGLRILKRVRTELDMLVTSDIHLPDQAEPAAEVLDLVQIPAFLCRQTDLVVAAARTGKPVNVKKGQFLAPWDLKPVARKVVDSGNDGIIFTERGTLFGYNDLVADMRSIPLVGQLGFPVVFDATHSVQRPGGKGTSSSGDGWLAPYLARAAVAAGCDGVFLEVHDQPEKALSDGSNMVPLSELADHMRVLGELRRVVLEKSC